MTGSIILVTGAAGLVGNAVCDLLEATGHQVVALDRAQRGDERRRIVLCDLMSVDQLVEIVRKERVQQIVHCGAVSGPMLARDTPMSIITTNILGTANVLDAARRNSVSRLVFCSSTSAVGNTPGGSNPEGVPLLPTSVYGASKAAGEQLVGAYRSQYGLDGVSLRLSWVFGPRRETDCVVREMIKNALAGNPTSIGYGRKFYRQFIYIDDAARAIVSAINKVNLPLSSYTITGGSYLTIAEIAEVVRQVIPSADVIVAEGDDTSDNIQGPFDISAARRDLSYEPRTSFIEGVRLYANWLKSGSVIRNNDVLED